MLPVFQDAPRVLEPPARRFETAAPRSAPRLTDTLLNNTRFNNAYHMVDT